MCTVLQARADSSPLGVAIVSLKTPISLTARRFRSCFGAASAPPLSFEVKAFPRRR